MKILFVCFILITNSIVFAQKLTQREKISLNEGWKFMRYENDADSLVYDVRPKIESHKDNIVADTRAEIEGQEKTSQKTMKAWILPTANNFIKDVAKHYKKPSSEPFPYFPFIQEDFNDSSWEDVTLPHDWAINMPFYKGYPTEVGGGMGRLPSHGVAWYRNEFEISQKDNNKRIYLDIDGAMSYAMVWLNGKIVGGWPYGYNSFRLDLTQFIKFGKKNTIAIRIDNPNYSSRWYPGGGLYRNVWLTKTNAVSVDHWGSFITSKNITSASADVDLTLKISNKSSKKQNITVRTDIFEVGNHLGLIASFSNNQFVLEALKTQEIKNTVKINNPKLWGPPPAQEPNLYKAVTKILVNNKEMDQYETIFGIRDIKFDANNGLFVNGKPIRIQGVNQHHDLGALGVAFNVRAAERQLEILKELGVNAIRMAHNPPAPELLDLTDKMGFLVIDEVFDAWEKGKNPHDFHLIFQDWYEADTRSFVRRDRNHPSIISWSFGNEVGEQYTAEKGAEIAKKLNDIVKEEDSTRPTTASMNYAKPDMPFPQTMDVISLNYQGEGIRDAPAYAHLKGIKTSPLYPAFHKKFPLKMIVSSETSSALSSRGSYFFPIIQESSAPASNGVGADDSLEEVSDYGFYTAPFGASPDKVFSTQDQHPYVSGEFVWSGFDYLGEPTPYYTARSSYSGIVDLAGFKKDRFYQYQSRWRPDFPMVHILPHWNWSDRIGKITPVHIFTSGDEVELFLNGKSMGKKKKAQYEYRIRFDEIKYEPGELKAVAYKNKEFWTEEIIKTTKEPYTLKLTADRNIIKADGTDLSFITVDVVDANGLTVLNATNLITFSVEGFGNIVATDNGDPADMNSFSLKQRNAFSGKALVIVKGKKNLGGDIKIIAQAEGLYSSSIKIESKE